MFHLTTHTSFTIAWALNVKNQNQESHTRTHTHARTHARTHAQHARTHANTHNTHARTQTHTTRTHARTHARTHTHTHINKQTIRSSAAHTSHNKITATKLRQSDRCCHQRTDCLNRSLSCPGKFPPTPHPGSTNPYPTLDVPRPMP